MPPRKARSSTTGRPAWERAVERLAEESRAGLAAIDSRIEALAEENRRAAEENNRFHVGVRGAIESLAEDRDKEQQAVQEPRELHAQLFREWAAYLRRLPPQ